MKEKTILVIEDDELNLKLVKTLLKVCHCSTLEAMDAENGIELARKHHPDMILMDIQLPGMDGLKATGIIKNDPDLKEIPVVAITAFAMEGDEEKALKAGCDGYIVKPINTRKFCATIETYCNNKGKDIDSCKEVS